jgi:hypothetical protein
MPTVQIGSRVVEVRRAALSHREASVLLRDDERGVRNRVRRGGLPVVWSGRRRRVDALALAEVLAGDVLALEALASIVEGRTLLPRTGQLPTLASVVAAAAGARER